MSSGLPAPEGFEWHEVGAYADRGEAWPGVLVGPHAAGWWDGRPYGAVCRGDHPLEARRCAWERLYVLRPVDHRSRDAQDIGDAGADDPDAVRPGNP